MRKKLILLVLVSTMMYGCAGEESTDAGGTPAVSEDELAARVGEWTLTREFLLDYIEQLPESRQREYEGVRGRARLADLFIGDELMHQEALKKGLEDDPDVQRQLADAKRMILISAYNRNYVTPRANPTEQDIHDYYELNQDEFTELAYARAQHVFFKTKEKADEIMERIEEQGAKLTTMAHLYSEDDLTRADGGDIGFFNPNGYMRGIGFSKALNDTLFKIPVGEIVGPVKWEQGYSIVRVNERHENRVQPYADVRDQIEERLTRERMETAKNEMIRELMEKYEYRNYLREIAEGTERSPEEMFNYAQALNDPFERIQAYEEIVEKFPADDFAAQAKFMIGFVYSEELGDFVMAQKAFGEVVAYYPQSDVAASAKWMMENIGKPMPEFETIDELNEKLQDSE